MKRSMTWIVVGAAMVLGACATTGRGLQSSAELLERRADDLTHEVRAGDEHRDYRHDAEAFAEEARDFRRVVNDRHADSRDVQAAFRDLSERYHKLRDEASDGRDARANTEFRAVTEAYLDVERAVEGERYASDRY